MAGPNEAQEVLVKVTDTGVGIPAHLQAAIFERYEQATASAAGRT